MLKYRVLTGGALLAMVAGMYAFSPDWVVGVLVMLLTSLAVLEVVDMLARAGYPALKWTTLGVSLLWMGAAWAAVNGVETGEKLKWLLPAISAWAVFLGCLFRTDQTRSLEKLAGSFFTIAYVPGLMQFILLLLFSGGEGVSDGRGLLLYGILVVKSTDMGAYFTGRALGKHKLIPRISPAKTWEGVAGGVGAAILVSVALGIAFDHRIGGWEIQWIDAVILGVLLAVAGVLGDLVESMLKRAADVKDSGHWLKGLGGVLDVLDSLVFALPMLYVYLIPGGAAA